MYRVSPGSGVGEALALISPEEQAMNEESGGERRGFLLVLDEQSDVAAQHLPWLLPKGIRSVGQFRPVIEVKKDLADEFPL
jgi:hypothetical protein